MYDIEIQELFNKLKIFEKMYEIIRFVDPVLKKVVKYKDNSVNELELGCYDFWGKNRICDNCVSMRAFNENEAFVKVEYTKDKVYMITAVPFELEDRRIVIELMKDTTNSLIFGTVDGNDGNKSEIYAMIDSMNNLALRDALTGIYNRRYINEKLPIELINAVILEQNLSVIMADIDFFKRVNDTYGHLTGDSVLKSFAETISTCMQRENDWIARFGGEEFLVCLPGVNLEKAAEIAEFMRKSVEEKEIPCAGNALKITASFGVCSVKPSKGDSVESLIQQADSKLYIAKNNGRNRVEY